MPFLFENLIVELFAKTIDKRGLHNVEYKRSTRCKMRRCLGERNQRFSLSVFSSDDMCGLVIDKLNYKKLLSRRFEE